MSLNGLDSPAVLDAYQRTIAEAGGWYLLKYTSRDSVELLSSGKRGVSEARDAIARYEEPSPLYGLIIYRRRKVLIKYIPDGTSRVLKARTAVHFQDVLEKYSPYETLLEITTAEGLNDTSLAAVFPLHTASTSGATTSASNSKLNEISEDQEDDGSVPSPQVAKPSSYFGSKRPKKDRRSEQPAKLERPPPPAIQVNNESLPRISPGSPLSSPKKATVSQYLVRDESGQTSITSLGTSSVSSAIPYAGSDMSSIGAESVATTVEPASSSSKVKDLPNLPSEDAYVPREPEMPSSRSPAGPEVRIPNGMPRQPSSERVVIDRSASDRPATSERPDFDDDPYDVRKYDYLFKPKVKLGPRPVAAAEVKRPAVASVSIPATYRPIAKKQEPPRPKSGVAAPPIYPGKNLPAPPPIPDTPEYNPRPLSRGSVKSLPSHKSTGMTPDKLRLMKAVELRKKQLRKSNPNVGAFVPPLESEVPAVPQLPETPTRQNDIHQALEKATQVDMLAQEEKRISKKPDSGIEMDYDKAEKSEDKKIEEERRAAEMKLAAAEAPTHVPKARAPLMKDSSTAASAPDGPSSSTRNAVESDPPRGIVTAASPTSEEFATASTSPATPLDTTLPPVLRNHDPAAEETRRALAETAGEQSTKGSSKEESANVPSIVMADGTQPLSPTNKRPRVIDNSPAESDAEAKSTQGDSSSTGLVDGSDKNLRHQASDIARRRRGFVEPIHLGDDEELSSDEDEEFMEELQSATVHQAKPMTVAKSPVATYFPRRPSGYSVVSHNSDRDVNLPNRSSTLPVDFADMHDRLSPDPVAEQYGHSRSASTPPTEKGDPLSIRRNVSNGIYQRVQNLASSRETSPQASPTTSRPLSPETSQGYFAQSKPPNARNNSFKAVSRHSSRMSSYQSPSAASGYQQPAPTPVWNVHHDATTNRESVSVKARIVRPAASEQTDSSEPAEVDLQQSQLLINHNRAPGSPTKPSYLPPIDTNPPATASKADSAPSREISPTVARASISTDGHRALHSSSKFGRHRADQAFSPIGPNDKLDDFPPPPTHRTNSIPSNDENAAPKESTRTSRFFKRMSNIGSKRRSGAQESHGNRSEANSERASVVTSNATVAPGSRERDRSDLPPAVVVGDLNIQFPDSLLWKRRIVEIDDSGCVLFSIPQPLEHQRGVVKKFAFADFKMPYVPDLERQELPNSILLDFHDGTSLQVACEDTMTHRQVVHVLKSYWKAWMGV